MRVELGNSTPHEGVTRVDGNAEYRPIDGPAITYMTIPDSYTLDPDADMDEVASNVQQDIPNLPNQEAFLSVTHAAGAWAAHSGGRSKPAWVWSDNKDLERMLVEFYGCERGRPDDVEDTHFTHFGPPGVGPDTPASPELTVAYEAPTTEAGEFDQS